MASLLCKCIQLLLNCVDLCFVCNMDICTGVARKMPLHNLHFPYNIIVNAYFKAILFSIFKNTCSSIFITYIYCTLLFSNFISKIEYTVTSVL